MNNNGRTLTLAPSEPRTYATAALLVAGNTLLPLLCHLVPHGGQMLLPIFFFTLVGAYKYGVVVGLATAVLSPILNALLTGMPSTAMLPPMLVQSVLLAVAAALAGRSVGHASLAALAAVVVPVQVAGLLLEQIMMGSAAPLASMLLLTAPGMALQVLGGYCLIKNL